MLFDNPDPYRKPLPGILNLAWGDFHCQLTPTNEAALENEAEWGIVAYIGADVEDLPEFLFANLLEMKNAGSSADVHVCAFFMGPLLADTFFARLNSSTSLDQDIIIRYNKRHANDVQTLVHALQLGTSFPAKKRVVVISGHGRGWKGLLEDEDIATEKYIRTGRLRLPGDGAACDAQLQACQTEVQNRMNAKRSQVAAAGPPRRYDVMALDACEKWVRWRLWQFCPAMPTWWLCRKTWYRLKGILTTLYLRRCTDIRSSRRLNSRPTSSAKRSGFMPRAGSKRRITQIAIASEKLLTFVDLLLGAVDAMGTMDTKEEIASLGAAIENAQYYTDTGGIDLKAFLLGLAEITLDLRCVGQLTRRSRAGMQ